MTYAAANARGRGTWHFLVVMPGIKYVLGTHADAPSDIWYSTAGHSYLSGLDAETLRLACEAHPGDV